MQLCVFNKLLENKKGTTNEEKLDKLPLSDLLVHLLILDGTNTFKYSYKTKDEPVIFNTKLEDCFFIKSRKTAMEEDNLMDSILKVITGVKN